MNISELIEVLRDRLSRHGDLEVAVTWEGITRDIGPPSIYRSRPDIEWLHNRLLIDADDNRYKSRFAADEGEE